MTIPVDLSEAIELAVVASEEYTQALLDLEESNQTRDRLKRELVNSSTQLQHAHATLVRFLENENATPVLPAAGASLEETLGTEAEQEPASIQDRIAALMENTEQVYDAIDEDSKNTRAAIMAKLDGSKATFQQAIGEAERFAQEAEQAVDASRNKQRVAPAPPASPRSTRSTRSTRSRRGQP